MELALSLGETSKPFRMGIGLAGDCRSKDKDASVVGDDSDVVPLRLELIPFSPVRRSSNPTTPQLQFRLPWLAENRPAEREAAREVARCQEASRFSAVAEESSFPMDFVISSGSGGGRSNSNSKRDLEADADREGSRGSDDDENGLTGRKKLRLSKEQSAFLEESFKEHSTLNPQKLALANQLNLRPRQVEVWFQNRRARTKLKQTEIDFEHLKQCCETLKEENRRLQKELQELRALKTSQPFYRQLPPTTLTMCPSCERISTASTSTTTTTSAISSVNPFPRAQAHKAAS
ncbi:hypothetical protein SAY87_027341 [Trapa incisa]|uniref:Homeobox domain-containing protein n=1 Tax=Trapa incisa TaxID=236973 RepID=A0AAN7H4K5_9MYRT|nr:hypothetical protein SAY87_027341 [Trapa incisa]